MMSKRRAPSATRQLALNGHGSIRNNSSIVPLVLCVCMGFDTLIIVTSACACTCFSHLHVL